MGEDKKAPLAEENLGLVHLCANRFRNRGIEYDDLYGAGCIGLIKATKSFDAMRGVKFSTYAVPVILGEIKRLFRDGGTIKVSRSVKELSLKITAYREKLLRQKGEEPTISQICEEFDVSEDTVIYALNSALPPLSLTPASDEDSGQIDVPVEAMDEQITDKLALRQAINKLEGSDRKLIYLRYFKSRTQCDTAKILGMTQVQVSRREKKILAALRDELGEKV